MVKIGMDTGGDNVKVTISVIDVPKYYGENEKRRASYCDGISPKQNKDTSVKKLLILAIVSKVQETMKMSNRSSKSLTCPVSRSLELLLIRS